MIKIKELRKELNLTQKEFAEKLNLTAHNIGDWEREKCEPSIEFIIKIAKVFSVSTDYLLGLDEDIGPSSPVGSWERAALSTDEKEILSLFEKLSPFARESILIQLRALAEKVTKKEKV